jgi:mycothiol system anti-sigma-R factor
MLNCREAVEKLYEYLDRQLSNEEAAEVRSHLDRCPDCEDHFRFEEGILTRVHDVCRGVETPATLRERVTKLCAEAQRQPTAQRDNS